MTPTPSLPSLTTMQQIREKGIDLDLLPSHLIPASLDERCSPMWLNAAVAYLRTIELVDAGLAPPMPEDVIPARATCPTCHGDMEEIGRLRVAVTGRGTAYADCPACLVRAEERRKKQLRDDINRRWVIPQFFHDLVSRPWLERDNAPASKAARAMQQKIMAGMPSSVTLFLFGQPGVGKTRLMAEIVIEARKRGLSSIMKTSEELRNIIHNYADGTEERRALAMQHLRSVDVLGIDEIEHALGKATAETILELVSHRISVGLTTLINGNEALDKLPAPLVDRLRAKGNLAVNMMGDPSARPLFGHDGTHIPP